MNKLVLSSPASHGASRPRAIAKICSLFITLIYYYLHVLPTQFNIESKFNNKTSVNILIGYLYTNYKITHLIKVP